MREPIPFVIETDAAGRPIPVDRLPNSYLDELARLMLWPAPTDEAGREDERRRIRRGLRQLRAEARKAARAERQRRDDSKETRP